MFVLDIVLTIWLAEFCIVALRILPEKAVA
jgi:hypothetical protein